MSLGENDVQIYLKRFNQYRYPKKKFQIVLSQQCIS